MGLPHRNAGKTCQEIATILGVSPQRIGQIEKTALRKFRAGMLAKGYSHEVVMDLLTPEPTTTREIDYK